MLVSNYKATRRKLFRYNGDEKPLIVRYPTAPISIEFRGSWSVEVPEDYDLSEIIAVPGHQILVEIEIDVPDDQKAQTGILNTLMRSFEKASYWRNPIIVQDNQLSCFIARVMLPGAQQLSTFDLPIVTTITMKYQVRHEQSFTLIPGSYTFDQYSRITCLLADYCTSCFVHDKLFAQCVMGAADHYSLVRFISHEPLAMMIHSTLYEENSEEDHNRSQKDLFLVLLKSFLQAQKRSNLANLTAYVTERLGSTFFSVP